jgi:proteasome lid subunit RPN8/RPN11
MSLHVPADILGQIHSYGQKAYPEEGAGLLLGSANAASRKVEIILPLSNAREDAARHNRYLITPEDMLNGEREAARRGMDVIGVFHSHPDHPNQPSEFDREWALPWFSYLITSVDKGQTTASRSWRLSDDRQKFIEEEIKLEE